MGSGSGSGSAQGVLTGGGPSEASCAPLERFVGVGCAWVREKVRVEGGLRLGQGEGQG